MKHQHQQPLRGFLDFGDETGAILQTVEWGKIKPFDVPAGAEVARRLLMQKPFRGNRLWIQSSHRGVLLVSFRVGVVEQLLTQIDVEFFSPAAYSSALVLAAADIAQIVRLGFRSHSTETVTLRCVLEGAYIE